MPLLDVSQIQSTHIMVLKSDETKYPPKKS